MRQLYAQFDTAQSGEYEDDIAQYASMTAEEAEKRNARLRAQGSDLRWVVAPDDEEFNQHEDTPSLEDSFGEMPSYNN